MQKSRKFKNGKNEEKLIESKNANNAKKAKNEKNRRK